MLSAIGLCCLGVIIAVPAPLAVMSARYHLFALTLKLLKLLKQL